jgi:hypothetical protein
MVARIHFRVLGGHVHVDVFTAPRADLTFAKSGSLVFRIDEWADVRDLLFRHAEQVDRTTTAAA